MGSSVDAQRELAAAAGFSRPSLASRCCAWRSSFTATRRSHLDVLLLRSTVMRSLTAIAALAVFLIVAEAPLRELLRAGRYRALRANLKPHAPPLNLSRVLEVAGAERCVGDGRCAGDELREPEAVAGGVSSVYRSFLLLDAPPHWPLGRARSITIVSRLCTTAYALVAFTSSRWTASSSCQRRRTSPSGGRLGASRWPRCRGPPSPAACGTPRLRCSRRPSRTRRRRRRPRTT